MQVLWPPYLGGVVFVDFRFVWVVVNYTCLDIPYLEDLMV